MSALDQAGRLKGLITGSCAFVTNRAPEKMPHVSRPLLLAAVIGVALAYAKTSTSRAGAATCPNEPVRRESNTNSATGQPYSVGLPECRAYEMVSPLEKQAHDAKSGPDGGPLVSPDGQSVGYFSEGAFAEPENTLVIGVRPQITYIARRTGTNWSTEPAIAPASVLTEPTGEGFTGDASLGLERLATCGNVGLHKDSGSSQAACASRNVAGEWSRTPDYSDFNGVTSRIKFWGASKDLSAVVFQMPALQPGDISAGGEIFETLGLGTGAPQLRLVSANSEGTPLDIPELSGQTAPYFGAAAPFAEGSVYQAISSDGQTVYFEAVPAGGGPLTLYARTGDFGGGTAATPATVEIAPRGTFVGASEDGSKVFFVTTANLTGSDNDNTSDLYEYDFDAPAGQHYVDISSGGLGDPSPGAGAEVLAGVFENGSVTGSVVAISPTGSHVYFHASSQLTTLPNGSGEHASPSGGAFCYDTETGETKLVASSLENTGVQTTADGRYLIFTTTARILPEDTNGGSGVYRYDFQTGVLTWISHAAPGFTMPNAGEDATLPPREEIHNGRIGATAYYEDARRAISENGEYVIFETKEQLQSDDVNAASDIYLWHDGAVSLVSDGTNPAGVAEPPSMSLTGSDIVFPTTSQLVGQDTDHLQDVYDVRTGGGLPAPVSEPSCVRAACQGTPSPAPIFSAPGTAGFTGAGNLTAFLFEEARGAQRKRKARPLTKAQKLANALRFCRKRKNRSKRERCERFARKEYGARAKPKGKKQLRRNGATVSPRPR
jgi:hypothetical protein